MLVFSGGEKEYVIDVPFVAIRLRKQRASSCQSSIQNCSNTETPTMTVPSSRVIRHDQVCESSLGNIMKEILLPNVGEFTESVRSQHRRTKRQFGPTCCLVGSLTV